MRPKLFVNYSRFCLFISHLAHEYKRMGLEAFVEKYSGMKYRGIYKNYLDAYIEYHQNKAKVVVIKYESKSNVLVTDTIVYELYYKFGEKCIMNELSPDAVPEFLKYGFLITDVHEAVPKSPEGMDYLKDSYPIDF